MVVCFLVSFSGQKQMLPGVMDLVLISINFLDLFVNPTQTSGTTTITSSESGATPSTSSSASAAPAPHATARVSATNLDTRKIERTQQDSLLGIVVAVNNSGNSNGNSSGEKYGEGGRVFQVHVLGAAWERVRVQVKDSATSVFAPGARRGGGGGQNASRVASGAQPNKV